MTWSQPGLDSRFRMTLADEYGDFHPSTTRSLPACSGRSNFDHQGMRLKTWTVYAMSPKLHR